MELDRNMLESVHFENRGRHLDVKGGSTENANLQVYPGNSSKSQLFSFIPYNAGQPVADGVYRIGTSCGEGVYLDAAGEPDEYKNETNVQIWDAGADNYFRFEYQNDGFYKIYDDESGLALDVYNPSKTDYLGKGTNVQLYTSKDTLGQYWAIEIECDLSTIGEKAVTVKYEQGGIVSTAEFTVEVVDAIQTEEPSTTTIETETETTTSTSTTTNEDILVIAGDVNNDGKFNAADVILLQKWLLAVPDTHLPNWQAADLYADGQLDVLDLSLMKRKLLND